MAEFNKGYYRRQGRKEGAYTERERIIKLLEDYAFNYLTTTEAINLDLSEDWHDGFTDAIALIKGEN